MLSNIIPFFTLLITPTLASTPPSYPGLTQIWASTFSGSAGSFPDQTQWNPINAFLNVNGELETYTSSSNNVQLSGNGSLQLIPVRDVSALHGWTSGRVESTFTFTPQPSEITRAEARIQFGANPIANKQGLWPAFWMLGDSFRHGTAWPECGEVDAMETVNGLLQGYGTAHCGTYPNGPCHETNGLGGSTAVPDQGWHTWRVEWDRTRAGGWQNETLSWSLDGLVYFGLTGSQLPQNVWASIAESPLYFILDMAVGGSWPGYPNATTLDGYGSRMEVGYVALYMS